MERYRKGDGKSIMEFDVVLRESVGIRDDLGSSVSDVCLD